MKSSTIHRTALIVITLMLTISAVAVPAMQKKLRLTLTDGSYVEATLMGDEHGHWYVDSQGRQLSVNRNGIAEYLSPEDFARVKSNRDARHLISNVRRAKRLPSPTTVSGAKSLKSRSSLVGKKRGIVLLVDFPDKEMSKSNAADFNRLFNEVGYSDNNCVGSVRDYFHDQSYGMLTIDFDVIGPIRLSKPNDYYGANDASGDDLHPAEMITEACKAAHSLGVDFSLYDWDGEGEVNQVLVIHAGNGEEYGSNPNDIWSHEWSLTEAAEYNDGTGPLTLDGVVIDTYATSCETRSDGLTINGIGTACHEFSHCLGIPDFYDTENNKAYGMGYWDVMASGNYSGKTGSGECPSGYTAYERWMAGWLQPHELDTPDTQVTLMPSIGDITANNNGNTLAYIIYNGGNKDEFYLLENRQTTDRWFQYYGRNHATHGLFITHVDYDINYWINNIINTESSHQRMTFFASGGNISNYQNVLFPGTSNNTRLTNLSYPSAMVFNKNEDDSYYMNKPLINITETGDKISFLFNPTFQSPDIISVTDIGTDHFTITWNKQDAAEEYAVKYFDITEQNEAIAKIMLTEDCSSPMLDVESEKQQTISSSLDNYTMYEGWAGNYVYVAPKSLKVGKTSGWGYIATPAVERPASGNIKVIMDITSKDVSNSEIEVMLIDGSTTADTDNGWETVLCTPATKNLLQGRNRYETVFNTSSLSVDKCRIKIKGVKNKTVFYLNGLTLYSDDINVPDTIYAEGLTETLFTVNAIHEGHQYEYSVRSTIETIPSAWSVPNLVTPTIRINGDANNDGEVTVTDIVSTANHILGVSPTPFVYCNADSNEDGRVTVTDIVLDAQIILSK